MRWFNFLIGLCVTAVYGLSNHEYDSTLFVDRLSYCQAGDIALFDCEDCTSSRSLIGVYDPISTASSQVVVVVDREEDEILVGFRGTINKISQWVSDLEVGYTNWYGNGKVHIGFHKRFVEMYEPTVGMLKKARMILPTADIIISGHSMGGAVATLIASALKRNQPSSLHPSTIITYGSPRVGNKDFVTYVNSQFGTNLIRVMNELDMVTDVPPTLLGYRHVGKLVMCKTGSDECANLGEMTENPGGVLFALKRSIATLKNAGKCHLTYLTKPIGTKRYGCK
jgi:hypothetical protein